MGSEEDSTKVECAGEYAQMFLIERIYIDFTVVAVAATLVESSSEPTLKGLSTGKPNCNF